MFDFSNKVVLVTGGTGGLGKTITRNFSKLKATTVFCGRREKEGNDLQNELQALGLKSYFFPCDISKEKEVELLISNIKTKFVKLDIAINNAAIIGKLTSSILNFPAEEWDKITQVNVMGTWNCLKHEINALLESGGGSIINIASVAGLIGGYRGLTPYSATKHAILGLTKSAALEFAHKKIRINAICPGSIEETGMLDEVVDTAKNPIEAKENMNAMYPIRRLSTSQEVADAVLWLASSGSVYVTGIALPVDGGWTAR